MVLPLFPEVIFHSRYDANHLVSPPQLAHVMPEPLDDPYLRATADAQLVAMKMLDVFDSLDAFTFDERARFVRQRLRYWKSVVLALRLDIVLFPFSPHTVYDYLILEICRLAGIRTVMFENCYPIDFATFFTIDSPQAGSIELQAALDSGADDSAPVPPLFEALVQPFLKLPGSNEATPTRVAVWALTKSMRILRATTNFGGKKLTKLPLKMLTSPEVMLR